MQCATSIALMAADDTIGGLRSIGKIWPQIYRPELRARGKNGDCA